MTLKLKTFRAAHVKQLQLSPFQAETLGVLDMRYGLLLEENSRVAVSLCEYNRVLGCWGLLPLWSGCSEAWMLVSPEIGFGSLSVVRSIQGILDVAVEHRIQTSVLASFDKGQKFIEFLGFQKEGLMKKYDARQRDHIRYARYY